MATQRPMATISYNTEPFLKEKLEEWYKAHKIQAYMYIKHKGEDGGKDHIHLRVVPNTTLDFMNLTDDLQEWEIGKKDPLTCQPWQHSEQDPWFLYVVHDPEYLVMVYGSEGKKHEKIPYDWHLIQVSKNYDLEDSIERAQLSKRHGSPTIIKTIMSGKNPLDLALQGEDVMRLNQCMRLVLGNDYTKLQASYEILNDKLNRLVNMVNDTGLVQIIQDEGENFVIKKLYEL